MSDVAARRVPQGVLVEDPKALVDGFALFLDLCVDAPHFLVELGPVAGVLRLLLEGGHRTSLTSIDSPAHFQVTVDLSLVESVVLT